MPRNVSRAMIFQSLDQTIDGVERDGDCNRDHCVFQDEVVDNMPLKRQVVAFHCRLPGPPRSSFGLPAASGLVIVVLASHSPASDTVLRVLATKPRRSKKPRAVSLASTLSCLLPRAVASFSSASHSMAPAPWPPAAPRYNRHPPIPRCWRGRFRPTAARRSAASAASPAWSAGERSSRDLPG